jgi:hypothetical protein
MLELIFGVAEKKRPGSTNNPGLLQNFTPQMPFRWISRSLLVNGG